MIPAPRQAGSTDKDCQVAAEEHTRDARRRAVCRLLLQTMELKVFSFGLGLRPAASKALAPNAYLEILLTLYLAELEGRRVYQSCLGGAGPPATAHRQAARLAELGAITRSLDQSDLRRLNMELTQPTRAALDNYVDAVEALIAAYPPAFR
jgi:hypothetical protein